MFLPRFWDQVVVFVRNKPLKKWKLFDALSEALENLVHPSAAGDALESQRHVTFMASCFAAGGLASVVFPLALAFSNGVGIEVAIVLGWMLAQLPLALFLSQTGKLEQAYAGSTALFCLFLSVMCAVSGGLSSFALIWFAVIPVEAALSGSPRLVLGISALGAVLIGVLSFLVPSAPETASALSIAASSFGALAYVMALALRFVDENLRMKAYLGAVEKRYRLLEEAAGDVLMKIGRDGTVTQLGGPLERILDISRRQATGDWLFQRVHVSDRPAYLQALAQARSEATTVSVQLRLRKGATVPGEAGRATYIWVNLDFAADHDASEGVGASSDTLRLSLRDVTAERAQTDEIRQARLDAEAASHTKTRFIASASHELRTPLNAIIGYADLMQSGTGNVSAAQTREYAGLIHQSGHHLLQLVEDILDASRIETGNMELSIAPVDVAACLRDCRAMMLPLAANAHVSLSCAPVQDLPLVPADARAVKQIVLNLVSNAVKYAGEGANIDLSACVSDTALRIEVRDNGVGIPVTQLARLGQPFVRIEGPQSAAKGTGLGLSIVKGLVELHGGHFELESAEGRGVLAIVNLPLGRVARRANAAPATNASSLDLAQSLPRTAPLNLAPEAEGEAANSIQPVDQTVSDTLAKTA